MSSKALRYLSSRSLAGQTKTAVIIGGTTGVGAGVARRLAQQGCERIIIFGRNEERAKGVMERIKELGGEGVRTEFVRGDLSHFKGMKASADAVEKAVGKNGIDYLIMCQNGPPIGDVKENADGHDTEFAIQSLSRLFLAYHLTTRTILRKHAIVLSIANPGLSLDTLDVEDLSLRSIRESGRSQAMLTLDRSKRDSTVLDAGIEELNSHFPQYRYLHLHPGSPHFSKFATHLSSSLSDTNWSDDISTTGLVKTELFDVQQWPFPLNWIVWSGLNTFASTPDAFAPVPVYLLVANEEEVGNAKYWDHRLKEIKLGKWASKKENRERLWEKLMQMMT